MNLVVSQFHIEQRLTAPERKMIALIPAKPIGLLSYAVSIGLWFRNVNTFSILYFMVCLSFGLAVEFLFNPIIPSE
jgi:hypothetical protein